MKFKVYQACDYYCEEPEEKEFYTLEEVIEFMKSNGCGLILDYYSTRPTEPYIMTVYNDYVE